MQADGGAHSGYLDSGLASSHSKISLNAAADSSLDDSQIGELLIYVIRASSHLPTMIGKLK